MLLSQSEIREKNTSHSFSQFKDSFSMIGKAPELHSKKASAKDVAKSVGVVTGFFKHAQTQPRKQQQQEESLEKQESLFQQSTYHKQSLGVVVAERLVITSANTLLRKVDKRISNLVYFYLETTSNSTLTNQDKVRLKVSEVKINKKFLSNPEKYENTKYDYAILVLEERSKHYICWHQSQNNVLNINWNVKINKKQILMVYDQELQETTPDSSTFKVKNLSEKNLNKVREGSHKNSFVPLVMLDPESSQYALIGFLSGRSLKKIKEAEINLEKIVDYSSENEDLKVESEVRTQVVIFRCNLINKKPIQKRQFSFYQQEFLDVEPFEQLLHEIFNDYPSVVPMKLPEKRKTALYLKQLLVQSNREIYERREEVKLLEKTLSSERTIFSAFMEGLNAENKKFVNLEEEFEEESVEIDTTKNKRMKAATLNSMNEESSDSDSSFEIEPRKKGKQFTMSEEFLQKNSRLLQGKKSENLSKKNRTVFFTKDILNTILFAGILIILVGLFGALTLDKEGISSLIQTTKIRLTAWDDLEGPSVRQSELSGQQTQGFKEKSDQNDSEQIQTEIIYHEKPQVNTKKQNKDKSQKSQKQERIKIQEVKKPEVTAKAASENIQAEVDIDKVIQKQVKKTNFAKIYDSQELKKFVHKIKTPAARANKNDETMVQVHLNHNRIKSNFENWKQAITERLGQISRPMARPILELMRSISNNYDCSSIKYLDMRENQLKDNELKAFFSQNSLLNMKQLYIEGNHLTGVDWLVPKASTSALGSEKKSKGVTPAEIKSLGLGHNELEENSVGSLLSTEWTNLETLTLSFKQGRNDMGWRLFLMNPNRWRNLPSLTSLSICNLFNDRYCDLVFSEELSEHSKRGILLYREHHPKKPTINWFDKSGALSFGKNQNYPNKKDDMRNEPQVEVQQKKSLEKVTPETPKQESRSQSQKVDESEAAHNRHSQQKDSHRKLFEQETQQRVEKHSSDQQQKNEDTNQQVKLSQAEQSKTIPLPSQPKADHLYEKRTFDKEKAHAAHMEKLKHEEQLRKQKENLENQQKTETIKQNATTEMNLQADSKADSTPQKSQKKTTTTKSKTAKTSRTAKKSTTVSAKKNSKTTTNTASTKQNVKLQQQPTVQTKETIQKSSIPQKANQNDQKVKGPSAQSTTQNNKEVTPEEAAATSNGQQSKESETKGPKEQTIRIQITPQDQVQSQKAQKTSQAKKKAVPKAKKTVKKATPTRTRSTIKPLSSKSSSKQSTQTEKSITPDQKPQQNTDFQNKVTSNVNSEAQPQTGSAVRNSKVIPNTEKKVEKSPEEQKETQLEVEKVQKKPEIRPLPRQTENKNEEKVDPVKLNPNVNLNLKVPKKATPKKAPKIPNRAKRVLKSKM